MRARGAAALVACALVVLGACTHEEPLRTLFHIPAFTLTGDDGQDFGTADLRNHVWIASFLYTSCTTSCPTLASQLSNIEQRTASYGDRVLLVSISVDPEVDTPERLHEYAGRFRSDATRWHFLTGHPETVRSTIQRGFLMPEPTRRDPGTSPGDYVLHGANVMLFDQTGGCRGLYRTAGDGLDELLHDVQRLVDGD